MREKRKKPAAKEVERTADELLAEKNSKKITRWVMPSIREEVRGWPDDVREEMGGQLNKVEYGGEPDDFKPMQTIGMGVYEIRVRDEGNNNYRLIYVVKFEEAIYVLHVITKKKSQKTPQPDIDTASKRFARLQQWRKEQNL